MNENWKGREADIVILDEMADIPADIWNYISVDLCKVRPVTESASSICECGSAAVGSPRHSSWCPLFQEDK